MELEQLRTFAAVAREGSLSAASEAVHLSQPAVSRQVQALERRLGAKRGDFGIFRLALFAVAGETGSGPLLDGCRQTGKCGRAYEHDSGNERTHALPPVPTRPCEKQKSRAAQPPSNSSSTPHCGTTWAACTDAKCRKATLQ